MLCYLFSNSLGKHSLLKQLLKRTASGFEVEEAHGFIIHNDISLSPLPLLRSNDLSNNLSNIIYKNSKKRH